MARADFNWMPFSHTFDGANPSHTVQFPIEGNSNPVDDAYLLLTAHNLSSQSHQILVNGQELPGFDLPIHSPGWIVWMDHIPPGVLHTGTNSVTVVRASNDSFTTKDIVVHWRE